MLSNNMPCVHMDQHDTGHSASAKLYEGSTMTIKQAIECGKNHTPYDILFTAPHEGKFTYRFKSRVRVVMETEYWVEDDKGNIYRPGDDKFTSVLDLEELDVRKGNEGE